MARKLNETSTFLQKSDKIFKDNSCRKEKMRMNPDQNRFDLTEPVVHEISPYDASYPVILLSNGIKKELEQAQIVAQNIYRAVVREMPVLTQVQQAMDKGCRYVVDA